MSLGIGERRVRRRACRRERDVERDDGHRIPFRDTSLGDKSSVSAGCDGRGSAWDWSSVRQLPMSGEIALDLA